LYHGLISISTAYSDICSQLHGIIVEHQTLTGRQKSACALIMAEADKALCDGADEELWVLEVALRIHKAITP
jgi:replication factor C subunit 2/4